MHQRTDSPRGRFHRDLLRLARNSAGLRGLSRHTLLTLVVLYGFAACDAIPTDPTLAPSEAANLAKGGQGGGKPEPKTKRTGSTETTGETTDSTSAPTPSPETEPVASPEPEPTAMTCTDLGYSRLVSVSTASGLGSALVNAQPGDLIVLADGTYTGRWTISRSGTAERPVVLCGSRAAILQDTRYDAGAVLTLSGVQHFVLHGFTVRKALWGVRLLSGSSYNQLSGLLIHDIGQEAVAINGFSSHNKVQGNEITHTGRRSGYERFGEGIYIGSTSARWTNGNPDRSDNNQILNNKIGPHVTADHLDIKEGTSGTIVRGNTFDGTGIQLHDSHYRALILTAGNHGLYENNILDAGSETPLSHGSWIWRGDNVEWGRENEFRNNTVDMRSAPGYGFYASSGSYTTSTTLLPCNSNAVKGAGSGPSNVKCK